MIVAILGAPGSFSELAARRLVARRATLLRLGTFDAVFGAVRERRAACGVVPVRNTIAGPVADNASRVRAPSFCVTGSLLLRVNQCLIARPGTRLAEVRCVASHPVALRQCARYLARAGCVTIEIGDTASGVADLMRGTLRADAVIGGTEAAACHGATVLACGVQDAPLNYTRFVTFALAARHLRCT